MRAGEERAVIEALRRLGLLEDDERPSLTALDGGVSSEIYRVDLARGPVCVKRALPRLKVAARWEAPVERNAAEAAWFRTAAAFAPRAVPAILAEDRDAGLFVMAYLPPDEHPVWKAELRDGLIDPATAEQVGRTLVAIHAATAGDADISRSFANDNIFQAVRLEPYLLATAEAHPACADALRSLAHTTAATRRVLVHGDVSPKNILVGAEGPVFLDAECAWYGDPAFDLAFCLNHLLLKCVWRPQWAARYLDCFGRLAECYLDGVDWEDRTAMERRTARLLPGLMLARIDGKSPVEYVTAGADKDRVRSFATARLLEPVERLGSLRDEWLERAR